MNLSIHDHLRHELSETSRLLTNAISNIIVRGEKLDNLVPKASELHDFSQRYVEQCRQPIRCCCISIPWRVYNPVKQVLCWMYMQWPSYESLQTNVLDSLPETENTTNDPQIRPCIIWHLLNSILEEMEQNTDVDRDGIP